MVDCVKNTKRYELYNNTKVNKYNLGTKEYRIVGSYENKKIHYKWKIVEVENNHETRHCLI